MTWQKKVYRPAATSPRPHKDKVAFARKMRQNPSWPEAILWKHMKMIDWGSLKWVRQKIVCGYIVDFAAPRLKLAIEVDGRQHGTVEAQAYDRHRDGVIKSTGWRIFRVQARDVNARPQAVVGSIQSLVDALIALPRGRARRSKSGTRSQRSSAASSRRSS